MAALVSLTTQAQSIFPLKISENRRHFVTQQGKPFLYHADTGWQIFTKLTTEEAIEYLLLVTRMGVSSSSKEASLSRLLIFSKLLSLGSAFIGLVYLSPLALTGAWSAGAWWVS